MPFLIIFIVIPLMELFVFANVSEHIGIFTTLLLAFLTAIIGGSVVRHQGMHTIMAMRGALDQGQVPLSEIFDGVLPCRRRGVAYHAGLYHRCGRLCACWYRRLGIF